MFLLSDKDREYGTYSDLYVVYAAHFIFSMTTV